MAAQCIISNYQLNEYVKIKINKRIPNILYICFSPNVCMYVVRLSLRIYIYILVCTYVHGNNVTMTAWYADNVTITCYHDSMVTLLP